MSNNLKDKIVYSPVLLIEFKGHPINRFTAEVYSTSGEIFDPFFICHEDNIHAAYEKGFEKLKEAMIEENTSYRLEKYSKTLKEYVLSSNNDK